MMVRLLLRERGKTHKMKRGVGLISARGKGDVAQDGICAFYKLHQVSVTEGVPQGSVHGPIVFFLFFKENYFSVQFNLCL